MALISKLVLLALQNLKDWITSASMKNHYHYCHCLIFIL